LEEEEFFRVIAFAGREESGSGNCVGHVGFGELGLGEAGKKENQQGNAEELKAHT
jgi:hypothetical protein